MPNITVTDVFTGVVSGGGADRCAVCGDLTIQSFNIDMVKATNRKCSWQSIGY